MSLLAEEPPRTNLVRDALRHRWLLVLGSMAVVAAVVGGLALRATPTYVSSASVFLQPITGNALSPDATVNGQQVTVAMETEAGLVDSPEVVHRVGKTLHLADDQLRAGVTASVPSNTKIVQIQYQASTPQAARAGAEAFAEAYLHFRESLASAVQSRQLAKLHTQVTEADTSLQRLVGGSGDLAAARREVLVSRLVTLHESIGELEATDVNPGVVSSPAQTPRAPAGLDPLYLVAAGLLLGLTVGLVIAVGREASDDSVRPSDATLVAGLPVLSELTQDTPVMIGRDADAGAVEAYRQLRVGIPATAPDARSICICDTQVPGDASVHTLNLAAMMSRAGYRVVVVDATADERMLDLVRDRLTGNAREDAGAMLDADGNRPLTVVSACERRGHETFVDEVSLARLVRQHRQASDYVLVAACPLVSSDGEAAGLACDCVLLVVEQHVTRGRDVERLEQRSGVLGISLCGVFSVPGHGRRRRGRRARLDAAAGRTAKWPGTARTYRLHGDVPVPQGGRDG